MKEKVLNLLNEIESELEYRDLDEDMPWIINHIQEVKMQLDGYELVLRNDI